MKDIRIFVASSKELIAERNQLAFLVLSMEEEFAARGLRVRLAKWEYVDPKMTEERTEDRYLEEMYDSDAALVLFRNIAGMYTREELDKALAAEGANGRRLKAHRMLFAADGAPDSDAARLRATFPTDAYGTWSDYAELRGEFLALVDRVAARDGLVDVQDEQLHTVTAFLAADDELASDRNAFADTVLSLNDILARRGVHVRLRFYEPSRHREMLESSEMALVLYHTTCETFGSDAVADAYDRTKREQNPKRLYVFFRDADESTLGDAFRQFRNGFVEKLGHFFCSFENADTLKLNFLLSLENVLGDGASFVKLDGRMVKADELDVGEITQLPMVANNGGLTGLLKRAKATEEQFEKLRQTCRDNPENDAAYRDLLAISMAKNELDDEVKKELSRTFDLAKRMAAMSIAEANEKVTRARRLLDEGRVDEALAILDEGSATELDDVLGLLDGLDEQVDTQIRRLEAWVDVELFRVDVTMAHLSESVADRFAKAESICKALVQKVGKHLKEKKPAKLASVLRRFAALYDEVGDSLKPIPLLEMAVKLYRSMQLFETDAFNAELAETLFRLSMQYRFNNRLSDAERLGMESLSIRRRLAMSNTAQNEGDLALSLSMLAAIHSDENRIEEAEREFREALLIRRHLAQLDPTKYDAFVADTLHGLAELHKKCNCFEEAEREYTEALGIQRRLAKDEPEKRDKWVMSTLSDFAGLYWRMKRLDEAQSMMAEVLTVARRLASANPSRFDMVVAGTLNNLSLLHRDLKHFKEAVTELEESLEIFRRQAQMNPGRFDGFVAGAVHILAGLHKDMDLFEKAEGEYNEALAIRERLAAVNPGKFNEALANTLHAQGALYQQMGNKEKSRGTLMRALEIRKVLAADDPESFSEDVAETESLLALLS